MQTLSQNKKIGLTVTIIFLISFSFMVLFLELETGKHDSHGKTNVIESVENDHNEELSFIDNEKLSFIEKSTLPHLIIDPDGAIDNANQSFCELLNSNCDAIQENGFYDLVNGKDLPEMVSIVAKLFRDGTEMMGTGPYRLNLEDTEVLVILDVQPIIDDDDKVSFLFIEAKDITTKVEEMKGETKVEALIKLDHHLNPAPDQIKALPENEIKKILVDRVTFKEKDKKSGSQGK